MCIDRKYLIQINTNIAFLLISLQSFYFYSLGVAPLPYLGILLLTLPCLLCSGRVDLSFVIMAMIFFSAVLISILLFSGEGIAAFLGMLFSFVGIFFFYTTSFEYFDIKKTLKFVISFHLSFFFLQVVYFSLFKDVMDYVQPVTGEVSRMISSKGLTLLDVRIPRFSGLFNEPGTYATYFGGMLSIYSSLIKRWNILILIGIVSLLFTMSAFSFVVIAFIICSKLITTRPVNAKTFLLIILAVSVGIFVVTVILERVHSGYMEMGFREAMINDYFLHSDLVGVAFGKSIISASEKFGGVVNDVGLWFLVLYDYGALAFLALILIILMIFFKARMRALPVLLLFVLKVKFSYPFFWLYLLFPYHKYIFSDNKGLQCNRPVPVTVATRRDQ